jgi:phospholipase/carboxylesterase
MTTNRYSALKGEQLLLKYHCRLPASGKTEGAPLLLLLHGVGGNEDHLFSYAEAMPGEFLVIAARAPFTLTPGRYAWFQVDFSTGTPIIDAEQAEKSRLVLRQFISQLVELYKADSQRIFMTGFSQGAIMSASVALTSPGRIAGIGLLSGRILKEIRPYVTAGGGLERLKIFLAHGIADNTLSIGYAREARTYLQSLGLEPEYMEYTMGHAVNAIVLEDLVAWLKRYI